MAKRERKSTRKRWSSEEIRHLRKLYRNMRTADVAKKMGRTIASVQQKAFVLGLNKTRKHLRSMHRA
jgi:hypothetical protein